MSVSRRIAAAERQLAAQVGPAQDQDAVAAARFQEERHAAEDSLYEFVRQAWSHIESAPFIDGKHIECVCDHLEAVSRGEVENLLVTIPPGHSKSLITSVFW